MFSCTISPGTVGGEHAHRWPLSLSLTRLLGARKGSNKGWETARPSRPSPTGEAAMQQGDPGHLRGEVKRTRKGAQCGLPLRPRQARRVPDLATRAGQRVPCDLPRTAPRGFPRGRGSSECCRLREPCRTRSCPQCPRRQVAHAKRSRTCTRTKGPRGRFRRDPVSTSSGHTCHWSTTAPPPGYTLPSPFLHPKLLPPPRSREERGSWWEDEREEEETGVPWRLEARGSSDWRRSRHGEDCAVDLVMSD